MTTSMGWRDPPRNGIVGRDRSVQWTCAGTKAAEASAMSCGVASLLIMADLVQCHRSVLESSVVIVDHVTALDLERPTPCIGWTLRQSVGTHGRTELRLRVGSGRQEA